VSEPIITVDRVVRRFRRDVTALDRLSLDVPEGLIYGLLGPNGAGKTTLIRILATLLPADAGVARVAGYDVRANPDAVRARIGLAGQYAAVDIHLSGRENVEMVGRLYGLSRRDARTRAAMVLERMGLAEAADRRVRAYSGACDVVSIWPRPWLDGRGCSSSTNRPRAWTRRAAANCGT